MNRPGSDSVLGSLRRALGASALAEATDEQLLHLFVAQQDEAAFAALLRRHGPMVWGICQRLVHHQQDAEDCFQATFLVLCRKAHSIGSRKLLANWLFGVARRAALNAQARRGRRARHETLCANLPDVPAKPDPSSWTDFRSVLDDELAALPSRYRLPLILCCLEGMTHVQASASLGWPVGTVAGRLSRGREVLRMRLARRGVLASGIVLPALLVADSVTGSVPPHLTTASLRSAVAFFMAGQSAPADISVAVASLVRGVLQKMMLHRLLTRSMLTALAVLAVGGAVGLCAHSYMPDPAPSSRPEPSPRNVVDAGPRKPTVRLPADPDAVVLRLHRIVDTDPAAPVQLTVFADGRVKAEVPEGLPSLAAQDLTRYVRARANAARTEHPDFKILQGKLSRTELEQLMRFVVFEQELLTVDADAVKTSICRLYESDGAVRDTMDTTTTTFMVQTADKTHQISWPRLDKSIWDFPKVSSLRQLRALDIKLAHIYYVMLAGGPERVGAVVDKLDSLLLPYYLKNPQAPYLTSADLSHVTPSAGGCSVRYQFARPSSKFDFLPQFAASIVVPSHGEPFLECVIPPQ